MIAAFLDVRLARRQFYRLERKLDTAEKKALNRAGGNVRAAYISGIRGGNTKALPEKVAPLDRAWREILHPGEKQGRGLVQKRLWPILKTGNGVVVDIWPRYRRTLEQYMGGSERFQRDLLLRLAVRWMMNLAARAERYGRVHVRGLAAREFEYRNREMRNCVFRILDYWQRTQGVDTSAAVDVFWLQGVISSLPPIHRVPARPVVERVRAWASAHFAEWYLAILKKEMDKTFRKAA